MRRIGVIGSNNSWYTSDLMRAGQGKAEVSSIDFTKLASAISSEELIVESESQQLHRLDAIIVRSMPLGSLEQIVFRMNALHLLERRGSRIINSPRSLEIAIDKYLTSGLLIEKGIATPATIAVQRLADARQAFERLGGDVVIKPIFGGEGRGICRVSDPEILHRVVQALLQFNAVIYLQPFIEHAGYDIRILFIGTKAFAMKRSCRGDWRTNVSQGAEAEPFEPTNEHLDLARSAAELVDGSVIGVDLLPALDGTIYVIELNAVPGWKALAQVTNHDIAAEVIQAAVDES